MPQLTIPSYTQLWPPMHSSPTADPQGPRGCSRLWCHCPAITQGLESREGGVQAPSAPPPSHFHPSFNYVSSLHLPSLCIIISRLFFMSLSIWNIKQTRDAACEIKCTENSFTPLFPNTIAPWEYAIPPQALSMLSASESHLPRSCLKMPSLW